MTLLDKTLEDAPPVHFDFESFHVAAFQALEACPLVRPGICMNPCCSKDFAPTRKWQRYCGPSCRRMDEAEMRRVGQKVAPALLAHQMGKDERHNEPLRNLAKSGRGYVTTLQSAWYRSRLQRAADRRCANAD